MAYKEMNDKPQYSELQPKVIDFWEKNKIFEKSVNQNKNKEITFYDGPPFPTGKPHHGTVLVSFIKDMIARYWTMQGYSVPRVWGWDCHGLPIENQAENLLGITDKNQIEQELGIEKFNDKCFEIVSNNNEAWSEYVRQMARWVDYDNAYKTMTPEFMESVMWAFKTCYDKGLIYRDYRVTPYCTHCETSLSISDTRESDSTRPRQDRWILVKFKADNFELNGKQVYFLAWTTTPWTLPSNLCLAVGEKLDYAFVEVGDEIFVACKNTLANFKKVFGEKPSIIKECKGGKLVGKTYEPLFPYFADKKEKGAFKVVLADYVGAEEGVGIVHTAPAFGEDDYWTCKKNNIDLVNPVDSKGRFTEAVTDFYGLKNDNGDDNVIAMNPIVIRFLYNNGKAVADGTLEHNYPHCWRCKRPLIYKAMDAYYFNIDKIKDELIKKNEEINWIPETVKHGRFGNWLEGARDWNISRNRYWSTPIPIWHCEDCGEEKVLGSVDEIEKVSGIRLTNLHRQFMDKVTFKCPKCGGEMKRVPEVLDCWFESGSVPFAQKHYPFENKEWFENHLPSDFVVEYTGQIRCWFYYLHVLSVALFDKPAFKNCVVHGTILAKDGKKLSKSSKNYTDPMELMKKYGTDAFRLYLYQTKAMLIGDLQFDDEGIQEAYQQIILPFWNACKFFVSYANIDNFYQKDLVAPNSDNQLDKWLLAKLYNVEKSIKKHMDNYEVDCYVGELAELIDGLTNWYIRRSRRRFWSNGFSKDKKDAFETLYYVLVVISKLLAPVAPIIAEEVYKNLVPESESVHLSNWVDVPKTFKNDDLLRQIELVQNVIYLGRNIRNKSNIKNRQPLGEMMVASTSKGTLDKIAEFFDVIKEELNVKKISVLENVDDVAKVNYAPNFNEIRNLYPDKMGDWIKAIKCGNYKFDEKGVLVSIGGEERLYNKSIIFLSFIAKEGKQVASENGIVVSLDTTITDELKNEGIARDIIRTIQDARKKINCRITDRINISISGISFDEKTLNMICNETLSFAKEKLESCDISIPVELDDCKVMIEIARND